MGVYQLNIELYRKKLERNGQKLLAIAIIHYPVYQVYADTIEEKPEHHKAIDALIREYYDSFTEGSLNELSALLGIPFKVLKSLEKQLHIDPDNHAQREEEILPIEEIEMTRNFLVDGHSFKPLLKYFYLEGRDHLIKPDNAIIKEKLTYYRPPSAFRPDIIHSPPSDLIGDKILSIDQKERSDYNIPEGLQNIKDVRQEKYIYPLGVVLSVTEEGEVKRDIIDIGSRVPNQSTRKAITPFIQVLAERIKGLIVSTPIDINDKYPPRFQNNWSKLHLQSDVPNKRAFQFFQTSLSNIINEHYELSMNNPDHLQFSDTKLCVRINKETFLSCNKRAKVVQNLLRGRDYIRQRSNSKVWIVMVDFEPLDVFMTDALALAQFIQNKKIETRYLKELINECRSQVHYTRELLLALQEWQWLEKLDEWLFMDSFHGGHRKWESKNFDQFISSNQP